MRHQAEDPAGWIADPCHIELRAVWVGRVGNRFVPVGRSCGACVAKDELPGPVKFRQGVTIPSNKLPFGMGNGKGERIDSGKEDGMCSGNPQVHPTILEFAPVVPTKGDDGTGIVGWDQESRLDEDLESSADPENQFVLGVEPVQRVG